MFVFAPRVGGVSNGTSATYPLLRCFPFPGRIIILSFVPVKSQVDFEQYPQPPLKSKPEKKLLRNIHQKSKRNRQAKNFAFL